MADAQTAMTQLKESLWSFHRGDDPDRWYAEAAG